MKVTLKNFRRCDRLTTLLCALCALCGFFLPRAAEAQSRQVPAPPQQRPLVIHSGTVHTVSGSVIRDNGYIVIEAGLITQVGQGAPPDVARAEAFDARGLHIYPGLIAAETTIGLTETSAVDVTNDFRELGSFTSEVRAAVAVNPDSDLIPVTRSNGILTMMVTPRGGTVSGRASIMRLDGWTWEQMAIDDAAGLVINWPRTEPFFSPRFERSEDEQRKQIAENLKQIEDFFDEALAYVKAREGDEPVKTDLRLESMRPVLAGEKPVFVYASTIGQIESAVGMAVRRDLKIVIVGGSQADRAIPLLKEHDVPVIIAGTHRLPTQRHEPYDEPFTLPKRLHEAGIRFAIASGAEPAHERQLNHNAATAAAYGLPREEALRAVTQRAAEILGIGATHGTIEPGKVATLIITTGDPLEITTDTLIAFIDGRQIDLGDRHKALYAKYREKYEQLGLIKEEEATAKQ
jgi:imidazolonepropionase-like amidohydrolase